MTKVIHRAGGLLAGIALSACVSGGDGAVDRISSDPLETSIGMGTQSTTVGSNGLPFAIEGQDVRDLETLPVNVRVGRMHRDRDTGEVSFYVSDEVVTLSDRFYSGFMEPSVFTLDGVTYNLETGYATVDGVGMRQVKNVYGVDLASGARHQIIFAENGFPDVFHEWGIFIMGFETNPATLPGGQSQYEGQFLITAWPSTNGGTPSSLYRPFNGDLTLKVDFDAPRLSGSFIATAQIANNTAITEPNVFGVIPETPLVGNGFEGTMEFTECLNMVSCSSNMIIGGAVYGADAGRIAGLIMSDATFVREGDNANIRLLGPGEFYADRTE